jgi:hypothetical protein
VRGRGYGGKSGFQGGAKGMDLLELGPERLGQPCPQQNPPLDGTKSSEKLELLGEPLSIREVACLIGCSVWTLRQRYLPAGLPHLRMRPNGKLIFYKTQIIQWLLTEQQKGGITL